MKNFEITRIDVLTGKRETIHDRVAEEKPLYVLLNGKLFVTVFCSPSDLQELAVGHLLSEGILKSVDEIVKIELDDRRDTCRISIRTNIDIEKRIKLLSGLSRVIFSACGTETLYKPSLGLKEITSDLKVGAETIANSVNRLNSEAHLFRKTGGVHAAAVCNANGNFEAFAEDVGRHNAVDKTIGICAMKHLSFETCFLVLTGRLSGDVVVKAARVRLPIVASLAAALDSGVSIGRQVNLTLVGFVRGKRMNVYSSPERIFA